jgi:hypothetical protein
MHVPALDLLRSLLKMQEESRQDIPKLLEMASALEVVRRRCLRLVARLVAPTEKASHPTFITVAQACRKYPVSRSFLYERGEREGIVARPSGSRKLVVNTEALERWLDGRR